MLSITLIVGVIFLLCLFTYAMARAAKKGEEITQQYQSILAVEEDSVPEQ